MARDPIAGGIAAPGVPNNALLAPNAGGLLAPPSRGIATVPKGIAAAAAPVMADPNAAMAPVGGGGVGGGGNAGAQAAVATQAAAVPSLNDYIKNNFLYTSTDAANQRSLDNYDAQTLKGQQDTQAQMDLKQQNLNQSLADQGQQNAENLAGRGLLRSGINFQNQDRINQGGQQQQNQIAQLLTDFTGNRQQGRLTQQDANQAALNAQIQALTQQYQTQNQTLIA